MKSSLDSQYIQNVIIDMQDTACAWCQNFTLIDLSSHFCTLRNEEAFQLANCSQVVLLQWRKS